MYSACKKTVQAALHCAAMFVFALLMVLTTAAILETPVEICAYCGVQWANQIVSYFGGP